MSTLQVARADNSGTDYSTLMERGRVWAAKEQRLTSIGFNKKAIFFFVAAAQEAKNSNEPEKMKTAAEEGFGLALLNAKIARTNGYPALFTENLNVAATIAGNFMKPEDAFRILKQSEFISQITMHELVSAFDLYRKTLQGSEDALRYARR